MSEMTHETMNESQADVHIDGFLLVFSLTSKQSLYDLRDIRNQIVSNKDYTTVPILLVGNKSDLTEERNVSQEEGKKLAVEFGCSYIETSVTTRSNIDDAFHDLIGQIVTKKEPHENNGRSSANNCLIM
eukprot:TRINITY_DN5708_c0_g1_i1.p1 TRINITY_DN5708_c0_g1~~TRINITY_DN5708_c0_g1_i1.p1  ORF type:complete len:129 (+),score=9.20 TRINITY_DN5708_c0_g1_i1:229-615(+)